MLTTLLHNSYQRGMQRLPRHMFDLHPVIDLRADPFGFKDDVGREFP